MAVGGAGMTTGVRAGDCGVAGRPRAPAVCVAGCAAAAAATSSTGWLLAACASCIRSCWLLEMSEKVVSER
eukprot:SAG25_NODE_75_length_16951_cov_86.523208_12_plen_71_part_00